LKKLAAWLLFATLLAVPLGAASCLRLKLATDQTRDFNQYPLINLRDDQPYQSDDELASVIFVGDIFAGRGRALQTGELIKSLAWLRMADLTVGNLEGVIVQRGAVRYAARVDNPFLLFGYPDTVGFLREVGFDVLGLANNHVLDLGNCGLSDTIVSLRNYGLDYGGVGWDSQSLFEPVIRQVLNSRVGILFLSAVPLNPPPSGAYYVNSSCPEWFAQDWSLHDQWVSEIERIRHTVDILIVSIHWGYEYETRQSNLQRQIGQQLVDAGADLVIGHHPHVIQGIEAFKGSEEGQSVVFYSLGNFLTDQQFEGTDLGLAVRILIDRKTIRAVQILPIRAGPTPELLEYEQVQGRLSGQVNTGGEIAFQCTGDECFETEPLFSGGEGLFWFGEADLTGDQLLEVIKMEGNHLNIYQTDKLVWSSPEEWQITDVAIGDPNQDGRNEVMVSFWKPDSDGILRSHPFVIGYREGMYRTLWGGSAVHHPILEIELADIDGDYQQELIVLEQMSASDRQAVSVWRWNGWGFSLVWRSGTGYYENLRVIQSSANSHSILVVTKKIIP